MTDLIERRSLPRVDTDLAAEIAGPSGRFRARVVDISLGGARLDATALAPVDAAGAGHTHVLFEGAMTSLEILLPDKVRVQAFARVRWTGQDPRRFGAEFLDLSTQARKTLSEYIAYMTASAATGPTPLPDDDETEP